MENTMNNNTALRLVEKLVDNEWQVTTMSTMKIGDVFRLDGDDNFNFKSTSNAVFGTYAAGVWGVVADLVEKE